jgi:hypothetical protein
MLAAAIGGKLPDILYDGIVDPTWVRKGQNQGSFVCRRMALRRS